MKEEIGVELALLISSVKIGLPQLNVMRLVAECHRNCRPNAGGTVARIDRNMHQQASWLESGGYLCG